MISTAVTPWINGAAAISLVGVGTDVAGSADGVGAAVVGAAVVGAVVGAAVVGAAVVGTAVVGAAVVGAAVVAGRSAVVALIGGSDATAVIDEFVLPAGSEDAGMPHATSTVPATITHIQYRIRCSKHES